MCLTSSIIQGFFKFLLGPLSSQIFQNILPKHTADLKDFMVGFIGFLEFQNVKVSFNWWFKVATVLNEMTVIWNKKLVLYFGHGLWRVYAAASLKGKGTGDSNLNQLVFFFASDCLLIVFIAIYIYIAHLSSKETSNILLRQYYY